MKNRIQETRRLLKEQYSNSREQYYERSLLFRYFISIDYPYKQTNYNAVLLDNKHLRKSIRKFYKDDIRMWFFIEKHTDPSSNHYGGYHRHLLIEDASDQRYKEPTGGMTTFMTNIDPAMTFTMKFREEMPDKSKMSLLAKAIRDLNQKVPNGYTGTDIQLNVDSMGGVDKRIDYCTKQISHRRTETPVVDLSNSDLDPRPFIEMENDLQHPRYEVALT